MANEWWTQGTCTTSKFIDLATKAGATSPSDVFFPVTQTDGGLVRGAKAGKYLQRQARFEQLARRTCGDCPVRKECLLDACQNDSEPPWGFTGGLAPKQRVDLLDGGVLISHECPGCLVTLWGTKKCPPPKRCADTCKG